VCVGDWCCSLCFLIVNLLLGIILLGIIIVIVVFGLKF